jgi:hypothetical protein
MKLVLLLFVFISNYSIAQSYSIKKDSLITFLYSSKGSIEDINTLATRGKIYLPISIGPSIPEQKLIKNNNGLYIQVDGTGKVYKATSANKEEMVFTRIDSTLYFGHNFGSIKFSYLDTLYNLGGNGYWHFFGHLIYFNEGKEWEIKKLQEEYSINSTIYYLNHSNGNLYYIQKSFNEVSTLKSHNKTRLFKLNLKTYENKIIGEIDESLIRYNELSNFVGSTTLNGSICEYLNNYYLLDFENNTISKLKNTKLISSLNGSINDQTEVVFEKNGFIHIATGSNRKVSSFKFNKTDFQLTDQKIFKKDYTYIYLIASVALLLLFTLILLKLGLIKSKIISVFKKTSIKNDLAFNEIEKSLIELLISKTDKNQYCDAEEVNMVLGLAKKSLEVQKKLRTEYIHRINHKFKVNFNAGNDLIERHKTEEDRRFLKYGISKANSLVYRRKGI